MNIRHTTWEDLPRIMDIYANARIFMAQHGNPNQWGPSAWPPETLIRRDIQEGKSYVCEEQGKIVGTFYFDQGENVEPCYLKIEQGAWIGGDSYGVIHRIASDGSVKGTGYFCMQWAYELCRHLRVDTHPDNKVMQKLLEKAGFKKCGIIHVEEDPYPRFAYEKL